MRMPSEPRSSSSDRKPVECRQSLESRIEIALADFPFEESDLLRQSVLIDVNVSGS
jgi:hypothetical protein